jgi:hypothetical protein
MVKAGLISQQGLKRGAYYEAAEPLIEIRERTRNDRVPLDAGSLFDA